MSKPAAPPKSFAVLRGCASVPAALRHAVVAIGNFDGVHRGHRAVLDLAIAEARRQGRPALALTFEPHTRAYFRPDEPFFRLSDEAAKLRLLAATGLDGVLVLPFDAALAEQTAEDFVAHLLVERLAVAGAVVGFDFHFGRARRGSPTFLRKQGERFGFTVAIAPPFQQEGRPVSSSGIRALLAEGRVEDAAMLLGHPWFVSGPVVHGDKRGRDLGFPTANMRLAPDCGLRHGIYAVRVGLGEELYDGVASFGRRPTFDNGAPLLETFLFGFNGSLYDKMLDVAFVGWIRPELPFASVDALVARIRVDAAEAQVVLAAAPAAFPALGALG